MRAYELYLCVFICPTLIWVHTCVCACVYANMFYLILNDSWIRIPTLVECKKSLCEPNELRFRIYFDTIFEYTTRSEQIEISP